MPENGVFGFYQSLELLLLGTPSFHFVSGFLLSIASHLLGPAIKKVLTLLGNIYIYIPCSSFL